MPVDEIEVPHCVACGEVIPADHPRPFITLTCSDRCRDARMKFRRKREHATRCKYCFKPSTPAERKRFLRWRNFEKKNPPPDAELSPEEIEEREYKKANPPKKRGPKPQPKTEEPEHDNDND
jgi:predicted nucleic acid-binding Zn ribbon protein